MTSRCSCTASQIWMRVVPKLAYEVIIIIVVVDVPLLALWVPTWLVCVSLSRNGANRGSTLFTMRSSLVMLNGRSNRLHRGRRWRLLGRQLAYCDCLRLRYCCALGCMYG